MNNITISHKIGPTIFDSTSLNSTKYLTVGLKYPGDITDDVIVTKITDEVRNVLTSSNISSHSDTYSDEMIILTDDFIEYLKNNITKIQINRVSLENYRIDDRERRLKTLKTKSIIVTADTSSLNEMFDTVVKELYYECGTNIIELYSVILAPKSYKIIDNIPVEYRNVLIRIKK